MNYDKLRRFAFIETRLFWGGSLTARELAEELGIARQNAQLIIQDYQQKHPRQMQYDTSQHCQIPTSSFKPLYINPNTSCFLNYQRAIKYIELFHSESNWSDLPFTDVDVLVRPVYHEDAVRLLLESLRNKSVVEIEYCSKKMVKARLISPHHLVFTDGRYHVRAYCHDSGDYRDFVLSRVLLTEKTAQIDWVSDNQDKDWNTKKDITFEINPNLPDSAQAAVHIDFKLNEQALLVVPNVRIALAQYIKRNLCRYDTQWNMPIWKPVTIK